MATTAKGKTQMTTTMQTEALERATQGASAANLPTIYEEFTARGIPEDDIEPRVNILTYHAWRALGRVVKRGEKGVRVLTWVPMTKKNSEGEAEPIGKKPRAATVFHISQTTELKP